MIPAPHGVDNGGAVVAEATTSWYTTGRAVIEHRVVRGHKARMKRLATTLGSFL